MRTARKSRSAKSSDRAWPKRRPKYGERVPGGIVLRGVGCPDSALDLVREAYSLAFNEYLSAVTNALDVDVTNIDGYRQDGIFEKLEKKLANVLSGSLWKNVLGLLNRATSSIRSNINESLKQVPSIKASKYINKGEKTLRDFRTRNVKLIRKVSDDVKSEVKQILSDNPNEHPSTLKKKFQERLGVSKSKADLWARDQTLKLHGQVVREKHESLGITEYYWRTSRDERVRDDPINGDHKSLGEASDKGVRYKYKNPPLVAIKGMRHCNPHDDFQCRCEADPILPD